MLSGAYYLMPSISIFGRRSLLVSGAAVAGATILANRTGGVNARELSRGPWAIELFTSQGCSSCPPADAQLGRLARRADIVALSFHVDYWDYIGWKDPFASRETTARQHAYGQALRQRGVYTPEMVVDGIGHNPGIELAPIEELLTEAQHRSQQRATPELIRSPDGALVIKLANFELDRGPADVTLAVYDRRHNTVVLRGENGGRTLENVNIVRHFETVSRWGGAASSWTIPSNRVLSNQGAAVLVQYAGHGPMIGCNKLESAVTG
jgi:hypothetical protein